MIIGTLKASQDRELRVAMPPESITQLRKLGHACLVEVGAGLLAGISDNAYRAVGEDAAALVVASESG